MTAAKAIAGCIALMMATWAAALAILRVWPGTDVYLLLAGLWFGGAGIVAGVVKVAGRVRATR